MADFWGPGLNTGPDADLAYRHERLFTAPRRSCVSPYGVWRSAVNRRS